MRSAVCNFSILSFAFVEGVSFLRYRLVRCYECSLGARNLCNIILSSPDRHLHKVLPASAIRRGRGLRRIRLLDLLTPRHLL